MKLSGSDRWMNVQIDISQHNNDCNSIRFTDIALKRDMVLVEIFTTNV